MNRHALIIHAHPDPASLTAQFATLARQTLQQQGCEVMESDLYAMGWKAGADAQDFPDRLNPRRLFLISESQHAYANGRQSADMAAEQQKLLAADLVIMLFPLWWYGLPALLKGWIDRVYAYGFAYGYRNEGNRWRYGDGALSGKRAMLAAMVGGPERDYGPRGINGPLEQLLFPVTHGCLFYPGMEVLPTHAVYDANRLSATDMDAAKDAWRRRLLGVWDEAPIPFRRQNGGDYSDGHTLGEQVAAGASGLTAHIAG